MTSSSSSPIMGPSFGTHTNEGGEAGPSRTPWSSSPNVSGSRRRSQPPLPHFGGGSGSGVGSGAGLRAALLGYLGEVEASIRSRLGGQSTPTAYLADELSGSEVDCSSSSAASDGASVEGVRDSGVREGGNDRGGYFGEGQAGSSGNHGVFEEPSSSLAHRYGNELRFRGKSLHGVQDNEAPHGSHASAPLPSGSSSSSSSTLARPLGPTRSFSSQDALLSHLSWLREDILASLPPAVLAAPSSSREWLKALPQRLMAVERGLWAEYSGRSRSGSGSFASHGVRSGAERGLALGHGAVESARSKVLEMVRGVLPDDEWEGWERLGWEETDLFPPTRPSLHESHTDGPGGTEADVEEEEEEESKFLFPNRTPAAAQAIASRRRTIRSKSLGATGQPGTWAKLQQDARIPDELLMPKLQRMRTLPNMAPPDIDTLLADGDEDGGDLARHFFASPTLPISATLDEAAAIPGQEAELATLLQGQMKGEKGKKRVAEALGPSVVQALQASEDGRKLIGYEDLPVEWRNNEHIITGYRFIPLHAATGPIPLIKSAFAWHNETINIHSHFIPTLFILGVIPFIIYTTPLPDAHPLDTAVLVLYLIAAISCLFSSAEWHVLSGCASRKWMEWGACVDYVGISWLIAASFGTVVYNAFYCQPKAVMLYCATNAACGALGSYLPFQRWFNLRRMKPYRIAFFLLLNVAMFAPMLQLFWKYGREKGLAFTSPFAPSVLSYLIGLLFYAFHFPECIWPGKFDHWGHSHQVWHAAIVVAIYLHFKAVFAAHEVRVVFGNWVKGLKGS